MCWCGAVRIWEDEVLEVWIETGMKVAQEAHEQSEAQGQH